MSPFKITLNNVTTLFLCLFWQYVQQIRKKNKGTIFFLGDTAQSIFKFLYFLACPQLIPKKIRAGKTALEKYLPPKIGYFAALSKWSLIGASKLIFLQPQFNKIQNSHAIHTVYKHCNLEIIIIFSFILWILRSELDNLCHFQLSPDAKLEHSTDQK